MLITKLVSDCKQRKPKAQLKLYNKYCDAMLCVAMRYLKQKDLAEDATQEAFIKAFKNIDNFKDDVTFGAWLKRIVVNQSIDYYRKLRYDDSIDDYNLELSEDRSECWEVSDDLSTDDVMEAIESLPEKYATVVKLYLIEGYDHDEISGILCITSNYSRTLLHRGKKLLQEHLNQLRHERFA